MFSKVKSRVFLLLVAVFAANIELSFAHGVLNIPIPKKIQEKIEQANAAGPISSKEALEKLQDLYPDVYSQNLVLAELPKPTFELRKIILSHFIKQQAQLEICINSDAINVLAQRTNEFCVRDLQATVDFLAQRAALCGNSPVSENQCIAAVEEIRLKSLVNSSDSLA